MDYAYGFGYLRKAVEGAIRDVRIGIRRIDMGQPEVAKGMLEFAVDQLEQSLQGAVVPMPGQDELPL